MNLRSLESQLQKLNELADQQDASEFYCERDEDGNLDVQFYDQKIERLPILPFRPYQKEVQRKLFVEGISRFFLVRSRRSGKEVESWNMIIQGAIEAPGLYMQIYPTNVRARIVLWEGSITLDDGSSVKFLDMIPKKFIASINNQDMSIRLINGSMIRVIGSDIDPDKLRGVNVRGAVFSEYAFSDPRVLHILMPVFRQNRGWFILQTTFNGMNHAYQYMLEVKNNPDWYCRVDSVETLVDENGQRYVTDAMIEEDRRSGMPEFMIQQEYYSVVQLNLETLYFANEMNVIHSENRIQPGLILPNKKVRGFMDIGIRDPASLLLAQMDGMGKPHIIAYYENNNKTFEYYVRLAESFCNQHGLMFDSIYSPHDGIKREFGSGKNVVDFGRDLGYRVYIVPRPVSKFNAIQSMRRMLYRTYFNKNTTKRLIDCLSNYSKEYDTKMGMFKDDPKHDWASHGVDSFQTMTLAIDGNMLNERSSEVVYINP